jgi:hypothetical protein
LADVVPDHGRIGEIVILHRLGFFLGVAITGP